MKVEDGSGKLKDECRSTLGDLLQISKSADSFKSNPRTLVRYEIKVGWFLTL